jgi:hypothetical protein
MVSFRGLIFPGEALMSQVKITDPSLEAELKQTKKTVTLRGADGHILGLYTPIDPSALLPRISEEEMQRRLSIGGGRKLSEILSDLEKRA